jgi:hypothetical protein
VFGESEGRRPSDETSTPDASLLLFVAGVLPSAP